MFDIHIFCICNLIQLKMSDNMFFFNKSNLTMEFGPLKVDWYTKIN